MASTRVAYGTAYPPAGKRRLPTVIVRRCPLGCGGAHMHRGAGGERAASCGRGSYVLRVRWYRRAVAA